MAIHFASPPTAGLEELRRHLSQPEDMSELHAVHDTLDANGKLVTLNEPLTKTFAGLGTVSRNAAQPYAVYTADSRNLKPGFLASARLTAWQYAVFGGEQVDGIAELAVVGRARRALSYASYHSTEYAQWILDTIADAEKLDNAQHNYELRILRVPSLSVLAVWLHDNGGQHDVILPIVDILPNLKRGDALDESELLVALRAIAANRRNSAQPAEATLQPAPG